MSLADAIVSAGVVGGAGVGYPTQLKLRRADVVIANATECDLGASGGADSALLGDAPDRVARGLALVVGETGASRGLLALTRRQRAVTRDAERALYAHAKLALVEVDDFYPVGDETTLAAELCTPGAAVFNVATLAAVADAAEKRPVAMTDRWVAVRGAVREPSALRVPIGTPVERALELAGGATCDDPIVIDGGPLRGRVADGAIARTTSLLTVLPRRHPALARLLAPPARSIARVLGACMQCGRCTDACPRPLVPHRAMRAAGRDAWPRVDRAALAAVADACIGCGACEPACPHDLSPRAVLAAWQTPARFRPAPVERLPVDRRGSRERLARALGVGGLERALPAIDARGEIAAVAVPLTRHAGSPSAPCVKPGDRVKRGQAVALEGGAVSARAHASLDGVVASVTPLAVEIRA